MSSFFHLKEGIKVSYIIFTMSFILWARALWEAYDSESLRKGFGWVLLASVGIAGMFLSST